MNDKWMTYRDVSDMYLDFDGTMNYNMDKLNLNDDLITTLRSLINDYNDVTMDDWFEDEPIVEKKIPEFNFVK